MNLHLLIIEDNQAIIEEWKEKLEYYEAESNYIYNISPTYVEEIEQAKALLSNSSFDAAVIDIRLKSNDGNPNKDGNELFKLITDSSLTVSALYTGEPSIADLAGHDLAKVFQKGEGVVEEILQWLDEKSNMIASIQNLQSSINSEMAKVFSKSIWPRWNYWLNSDQDQDQDQDQAQAQAQDQDQDSNFSEGALIRHMATHLHASFLNEVSSLHPEEYYFIPPLQDRFDTGDIFFFNNFHYVLVTPRCDLARCHNPTFQLVKLSTIKEEWDELHILKTNGENRKIKERAPKEIRKLVNHGDRSPKLHFIPHIKLSNEDILGPFHAQFNDMLCLDANDENRLILKEGRLATLSNEFVPSLVERLGAYFSRIGTPDYSHPE